MSNYIDVNLNMFDYKSIELEAFQLKRGHELGQEKFGEKWEKMIEPWEKKLRIVRAPFFDGDELNLRVSEYEWPNLQKMRMVQASQRPEDEDMSYLKNVVVLTGNAFLRTWDDRLVFHYKKGGYLNKGIHTFGGYVTSEDLAMHNSIENAIVRELCENDELGLEKSKINIEGLFGTLQNLPSILWDFGTAAIYGDVYIEYTSKELRQKVLDMPLGETESKKLYIIQPNQLDSLVHHPNLHPQTRKVIPNLEVILYD